jgi:hypothetical protein
MTFDNLDGYSTCPQGESHLLKQNVEECDRRRGYPQEAVRSVEGSG